MHSVGMFLNLNHIVTALKNIYDNKLKTIYSKSGSTLPFKAKASQDADRFMMGDSGGTVITENNLKFEVDWMEGQKTGFFIDQRENRLLLKSLAKNREVLNMFCYTGGFSVYALRRGKDGTFCRQFGKSNRPGQSKCGSQFYGCKS